MASSSRFDSLATSSSRLGPSSPRDGDGHASPEFIRSRSIPNDFVSFMTVLSSMFVNSEFAVHYHSPDVLISPPVSSGLSFEVKRYRIQRDEDRIRISKDRVLGKGSEIVHKIPRIAVNRFGAIIREVRILTHKPFQSSENIVQLLGITWHSEPGCSSLTMPVLVIEYGTHGTLLEYFVNEGPIPMQQKLQLALGIVEGLLALHHARVVHADVKATNIIVYKSERQVTAKLADFGSAILLDDIPDEQVHHLTVFSRFWTAPEYRDPISKAALPAIDAYSFGLVFWQLILELEDPFKQNIFLAEASPGGPEGSPDTEMRHELVQNMKYRANDEFLDVAWETLSQEVKEITVLRQVFDNTLRRESCKRDLSRVRYYLSEQATGRGAQALAHASIANERPPVYVSPRVWADEESHISLNYEELHLLDYATKSQLYRALKHVANTDSDVMRQAEACFQLSVCNIIAFGTLYNGAVSLDWLIQSARRGYIPAQALVKRMHDALNIELPSTLQQSLLSWLKAAVEVGSFVAMEDLENACHAGTYLMEEFNNSVVKFRTTFCGTGYKHFDDSVMERYALGDTIELERLLGFEHQTAENNTKEQLPALNDRGDTLLHWAAINGNTAVLNTILRSASNRVNVANNFNETPLFSACRSGQFQAATCLLGWGADAAISTPDGESPLHWLISFTQAGECTEIAQRLEKAGADVNMVAAENTSCFNLFSNFLIPGTPLHRATARNHLPAVRALLELQKPADPFAKGGPGAVAIGMERPTPVIWASAAHESDVLSLFLDRTGSRQLNCGLELHNWRNIGKALYSMALVTFGGYDIFDTPMMQHRSQLPGFTLLFSAIYADNLFNRMILHGRDHENAMKKSIDLLIRRGANPGRVDPMGATALYAAVERGDVGIVRHILSHQTAKSALENKPRGRSHMRPLHQAILYGRRDIFDILLQAGADITAKWGNGSNCLHMCGMAKVPDVGITEKVVSLDRAQIYAYDNTETPFCTAVRHHNFNIADLLLHHGAEKDVYVGENRSTTLLGAILGKGGEDSLPAARYLLEPRKTGEGRAGAGEPPRFFRAQFITCPAGGYSALHAPFLIRLHASNMPAQNYGFEAGSAAPIIRYLLSIFSDPEQLNARDNSDLTPLHYAVAVSDADAVEELLKYREWGLETSPVGLVGGQELTPLDLAEGRCAEPISGNGTVLVRRKMIAEAERIRKLLLDVS